MGAADIHPQQFVRVQLRGVAVVDQVADSLGKILGLGPDTVLVLGMLVDIQLLVLVGSLLQLVDNLLLVVDKYLQFVGSLLPVVVAVVGSLLAVGSLGNQLSMEIMLLS